MTRETGDSLDDEVSADVEERLDRIESLVEQQQQTIESQQAELDRRAEQLEQLRTADEVGDDKTRADGTVDTDGSSTGGTVSPADSASDIDSDDVDTEVGNDLPGSVATRRAVLTSGSVLGLFGLGVGSASADSQGQVGTSTDELNSLYTAQLNGGITGDTELTSLVGNGLQIASGSLVLDQSITPKWTGTHTWDTGESANLTVDETGFAYSTADVETLNVRNTGGGIVTLEEDGTPVVTETRSLIAGNAIESSLGNLSTDRTIAVDESSISHDNIDQTTVDSDDHHTRPSAGSGLTEESNAFKLANTQFREPTTEDLTNDTSFGSWKLVDQNRPAFIEVEVNIGAENVKDGGKTDGLVILQLDETGTNSADFTYQMDFAGISVVPGNVDIESRFRSVYIPPGGQFKLINSFDPDGFNGIRTVRAIVG